jgi:hypothetical protein
MPQGGPVDAWRRNTYVFLRSGHPGTAQEAPGGTGRPQEAQRSPRRCREAPGRPRGRLEAQNVRFPTIWVIFMV